MSLLRIVFILLVSLGYFAVGWFVLKFRPMQDQTLDTILGCVAILYGIFRLVRGFFIPKQEG